MSVLALVFLGWSSLASAGLIAGTDYTSLRRPVPTDTPGKIEVIQFFSYGCPHCADMHSMVDKWVAKLPKDVVFRRVPVSFGRSNWASLQKAYFALKSTGDLQRMDGSVYDAIHKLGVDLKDEATITAWLRTKGVDAAKFSGAYNSFSVNSDIARAEDLTKEYNVDGVPFFAVDGRYIVIGHSYQQMLDATSQLIDKARNEPRQR